MLLSLSNINLDDKLYQIIIKNIGNKPNVAIY